MLFQVCSSAGSIKSGWEREGASAADEEMNVFQIRVLAAMSQIVADKGYWEYVGVIGQGLCKVLLQEERERAKVEVAKALYLKRVDGGDDEAFRKVSKDRVLILKVFISRISERSARMRRIVF